MEFFFQHYLKVVITISIIISPGLLRDVTGSYVASFHLLGGLAYVGGVLAFLIPIVNKWMNGKKEKVLTEDPANKT
jgi:hypothetical protein